MALYVVNDFMNSCLEHWTSQKALRNWCKMLIFLKVDSMHKCTLVSRTRFFSLTLSGDFR